MKKIWTCYIMLEYVIFWGEFTNFAKCYFAKRFSFLKSPIHFWRLLIKKQCKLYIQNNLAQTQIHHILPESGQYTGHVRESGCDHCPLWPYQDSTLSILAGFGYMNSSELVVLSIMLYTCAFLKWYWIIISTW